MALSNIDLCNQALSRCGAARITGMPPGDTSDKAYLCQLFYQQSVDEVLMDYDFQASITRKELAGTEHALTDEWSYEYPLPTNPYCLRVINIPDYKDSKWTVEGRILLCNLENDVVIRYIRRITESEMNLLHAALVEAIVIKLASHLSTRLKQSRTGYSELVTEYKNIALPDAIWADQKGSNNPPVKNKKWVKAGR